MNQRFQELAKQAGFDVASTEQYPGGFPRDDLPMLAEFARLVAQECINKIETYQIPVGNSAAGEMACEWTYDALKEVRDEIKQTFGVKE